MKPLLSTGQRDRSRVVLTVLSGTLAAGAVAATGAATALAAQETAHTDALKAQAKAKLEADAAAKHHRDLVAWAKAHPVVVTKPRPVRTVVGPTVIGRASGSGNASVRRSTSSSGGGSSSSSGGTRTVTSAPPPPPPPPPATGTGS